MRLLYAGANRMTRLRVAHLDLPEASAMRMPGEAPGMMVLEIAMDELADKLGISGLPAAIANAVHNATGVHVRDYPITLDKLLDHLPTLA